MGRTLKDILETLPKERRKKIETRSEKIKRVLEHEPIMKLIEAINQRDDPQIRDDAYNLIMEHIDELMDMNDGEGPSSDSEDGVLLELLAEAAEEYEKQPI